MPVPVQLGLPSPPPYLLCPLSRGLFHHPVIDDHGHTFEGAIIRHELERDEVCPLDRQPLHETWLVRNKVAEDAAIAFLQHHPAFHPVWALEEAHLVDLDAHHRQWQSMIPATLAAKRFARANGGRLDAVHMHALWEENVGWRHAQIAKFIYEHPNLRVQLHGHSPPEAIERLADTMLHAALDGGGLHTPEEWVEKAVDLALHTAGIRTFV